MFIFLKGCKLRVWNGVPGGLQNRLKRKASQNPREKEPFVYWGAFHIFGVMGSRDERGSGRWPHSPPHLWAGSLLGNNLGRCLFHPFWKITGGGDSMAACLGNCSQCSAASELKTSKDSSEGKTSTRADGYCLNCWEGMHAWWGYHNKDIILKTRCVRLLPSRNKMRLEEKCATVMQVIFHFSGACLSGVSWVLHHGGFQGEHDSILIL